MQRSVWKLPFTKFFFFANKFYYRKRKDVFFTMDRSSTILGFFLDKRIRIYSGKNFMILNIANKKFIGHKLGDFSFTKIRGFDISISVRRKSNLKKKQKIKTKNKKVVN